jgi:tRNA pseudouridine55 synthase
MNGVFNILKPAGMSSSDVVARMRRILGQKKVGHLGTLDPAAAGVLPILAGKATRLFDYLSAHEKVYVAEFFLGVETDTLDAEGQVTRKVPWTGDREALEKALLEFEGTITQTPPVYSAVKLAGKKAYDLARKGHEVEIPARQVTISKVALLSVRENRVWLRVECETGTYIRSLCRDLAQRLGTCGHLSYLLRTQSGGYRLEESLTLAQAAALARRGALAPDPMERALDFLPRLDLGEDLAKPLVNGVRLKLKKVPPEPCRVYCGGAFYGIGSALPRQEEPVLRMNVLLPPEE